MYVEFKNSLECEVRCIFNFFSDPHSPKNWFWIPNISFSLIEKIKKANFLSEELKKEIKGEIKPLYLKFKPLVSEQLKKIKKAWSKENFLLDNKMKIICWCCLFLPGGLFNYNTNEIFVGVNRPVKKIIQVVKHEILHLKFWEKTKNMDYITRENFITEKMNSLENCEKT